MIRFRFREDEKRYVDLMAEVYRLVAANLPPEQVSTALRNLGKMQDLLMLEGVRQGVAAAAISNLGKSADQQDLEHMKAFQLHAHVYGSQDTPLRDIEEEWLEKLGAEHHGQGAWLDPKPMRFAPDTEQAFMRQQKAAASSPSTGLPSHPVAEPWADMDISVEDEAEADVSLDEIDELLEESDGKAQQQPQLLDRIRETLQDWAKTGLKPRDWEDLIMRLHLLLHVDAGFIDLQLGTDMGRAVLAQAGFHDIQPGPFGTNLQKIVSPPVEAQEPEPTPAGGPPADDSSPEDE